MTDKLGDHSRDWMFLHDVLTFETVYLEEWSVFGLLLRIKVTACMLVTYVGLVVLLGLIEGSF